MSGFEGWKRQVFQLRIEVPSTTSLEAEVILRLAHESEPIEADSRVFLQSVINKRGGHVDMPVEIYLSRGQTI